VWPHSDYECGSSSRHLGGLMTGRNPSGRHAAALFLVWTFAFVGVFWPLAASGANCDQLRADVYHACCPGELPATYNSPTAAFTSAGQTPQSVQVHNCDGTTTTAACVPRAGAASQTSPIQRALAPQRYTPSQPTAVESSCLQTWTQAKQSCPAIADLPACQTTTEISALPFCEDLQALNATDHCSVWNNCNHEGANSFSFTSRFGLDGSDRPERKCLDQAVNSAGRNDRAALLPAFTVNGTIGPLDFPPPKAMLPGTRQPAAVDDGSLAASQRIIPGFRIEMPGNFLRYFTRHAGLEPGFQALSDGLANKTLKIGDLPVDGNCDAKSMSCSINQVHLFDLNKFIADNRKFAPSTAPTDPPQGFVNATVKQTSDGWDVSHIDVNVGPFQLHWWGNVSIASTRPLSFRFDGDNAHLKILPLHDPKNENPPFKAASLATLDSKARFLDRVWVLSGLDPHQCTLLRDRTFAAKDGFHPGTPGLGSGKYETFIEPYKCGCQIEDSLASSANYCVIDPLPRQTMIPEFDTKLKDPASLAAGLAAIRARFTSPSSPPPEIHEVFCDPGSERVIRDPRSDLGASEPLVDKNSTIQTVYSGVFLPGDLANLRRDIFDFGCMGRQVSRMAAGDVTMTPLLGGNVSQPLGKEISSGIGFLFETEVDLGEIKVSASPSPITVDFPMEFEITKYIQKKVPILGSSLIVIIIGWILEIVLAIVAALLTVFVSIELSIFGPLLSALLVNTIALDAGHQPFRVDGIITNVPALISPTTGNVVAVRQDTLQVGVRRIVTGAPDIRVKTWEYKFKAPVCNDLASPPGSDGFTQVLNFLKATALCPLEIVASLANGLTLPIRNLLLWLLDDIVFDVVDAVQIGVTAAVVDEVTKAEDSSSLATLMVSSLQTAIGTPAYFLSDASIKAKLAPLQPFLNDVCMLTGDPLSMCAIANLFGFNGEAPAVVRLGAKTHYRSMHEYKNGTVTEILKAIPYAHQRGEPFYPPVRYCYGGDVPVNGLFDYRDDGNPALIQGLANFEEMHYTNAAGDHPTDWSTQCAAFVDMRVKLHVFVPALSFLGIVTNEIIVAPSTRTNFLINEVLFCPDDASCDPGIDTDALRSCLTAPSCDFNAQLLAAEANTAPIPLRAQRAICSMLGDIWFRQSPGVGTTSSKPFKNMAAFTSEAKPALIGLLTSTCPINNNCAAQISAVNTAFDAWRVPCSKLLSSSGLFNPERTLNLSDVPPELQ
jgi:hypothetical protein